MGEVGDLATDPEIGELAIVIEQIAQVADDLPDGANISKMKIVQRMLEMEKAALIVVTHEQLVEAAMCRLDAFNGGQGIEIIDGQRRVGSIYSN